MLKRYTPALLAAVALFALPAAAQAEPTAGTGWEAYSQSYPTNLKPGGSGVIQLDVINTGAKPSKGSVTVTDTLPEGLEATKSGGMPSEGTEPLTSAEETSGGKYKNSAGVAGARWACSGTAVVTCTSNPEFLPSLPYEEFKEAAVTPVERLAIVVKVAAGASGSLSNHLTIAGGGAVSTTNVSDPLTVSASEPGFGFPGFDVWFSNAEGGTDTQAGSHPYAVTFVNGFNELQSEDDRLAARADGEPRDLEAVLPPGFFGDPAVTPRCTRAQLDSEKCPAQTQIGIDGVGRSIGSGGVSGFDGTGVYNMVPPPGVADAFGFVVVGKTVIFEASPSSADGYRIVTHIDNIPEGAASVNILTLWGVPGEASHDFQRCTGEGFGAAICDEQGGFVKPFLTLPTSCEGPQQFTLRGLSTWMDPNATAESTVASHDNTGAEIGFTGCEKLQIEPTLSTVPDTSFADTPAGLTADVHVPQATLEEPEGLVAATLKNTSVTLPEGLVINPGQAAGLLACGEAEANIHGEGPQSCPSASKVGTVKIQTPLLEEELEPELTGDVYVLQSNPPNLRLLVAASADGVYLKLVGDVHLSETGQLTTTFTETPELPFTDFKLSFSGGAQAALATPTQCGFYSTTSDFTPWTSPLGAEVLGSNGFSIGAGPLGAACPSGSLPFGPSLIAGATNPKGGAFTSFSLLLQRPDGQQRIDGLQFKAPAGLAGMITNVPLCPEPQAQQGTCPASSRIGHTSVASGTGPYPLIVPEPGRPEAPIYLTGPYEGAPFGLSIVTPVLTGPFNLGTIVTRARIEVDPHTAAITVTTDPLPQVIDGVPTDLRTVDSVIERPDFMFNPTRCEPSAFSGTAYGTPPPGQGGVGGIQSTAAISSAFDVVGCKGLAFEPKFTGSTSGKTSKARGADLVTKVSYPNVPQGTDADITRVKVDLPKQLPSRLTTLQKACTNAQFERDPANCPSESKIGYAVVHTPLLPVPLVGPAIFVSHGGEAFPSLTMVLQGDNVTVDLVGTTYISPAGITSTTFKTLPDSPFSSFELTLPEGKFSALAANGNLCTSKLAMPTELLGQNGAKINESTPISVTGCKPAITVTSHKVKGKTATIQVSVPAAGKLVATGKGLSKASKTAKGATTLTLKLTLTKGEVATLKKHKGRKLKDKIELRFTPKQGSKLATTTTVLVG